MSSEYLCKVLFTFGIRLTHLDIQIVLTLLYLLQMDFHSKVKAFKRASRELLSSLLNKQTNKQTNMLEKARLKTNKDA